MSDQDDAIAFIRKLVGAWDCCGTCAGGVLAEHDRQVRRAVAEEIAVECESNIDWSNGRNNYGDNEGYEHAARIAREVGGIDDE